MSLIKQRQGRPLGIVPIKGLDGNFRYETIYQKKSFKELTVAKTLNTIVTCRVCTGAGIITHVDSLGYYTDSICPECDGSKKMISV